MSSVTSCTPCFCFTPKISESLTLFFTCELRITYCENQSEFDRCERTNVRKQACPSVWIVRLKYNRIGIITSLSTLRTVQRSRCDAAVSSSSPTSGQRPRKWMHLFVAPFCTFSLLPIDKMNGMCYTMCLLHAYGTYVGEAGLVACVRWREEIASSYNLKERKIKVTASVRPKRVRNAKCMPLISVWTLNAVAHVRQQQNEIKVGEKQFIDNNRSYK